jgi:hypothetical protein
MARCDIGHDSKTFGREVRHWSNPASRGRKESRFTRKRSVRTNAYMWFARSASLGNRQEGPRVCLWTRRANRGVKLRETESDQSQPASYHPAQVNGQTPRGAPGIFGGISRSTCRGRRYRLVPVARSDATFFGRKHDMMSSTTVRVVPHRPGTRRLARSPRAPIL